MKTFILLVIRIFLFLFLFFSFSCENCRNICRPLGIQEKTYSIIQYGGKGYQYVLRKRASELEGGRPGYRKSDNQREGEVRCSKASGRKHSPTQIRQCQLVVDHPHMPVNPPSWTPLRSLPLQHSHLQLPTTNGPTFFTHLCHPRYKRRTFVAVQTTEEYGSISQLVIVCGIFYKIKCLYFFNLKYYKAFLFLRQRIKFE